jgi:hypothetical protein
MNIIKRFVGKVADAVYSPTMQSKVAQGGTELCNALFNQANGYSPYTADNAAHRAKFQAKDQAKGIER